MTAATTGRVDQGGDRTCAASSTPSAPQQYDQDVSRAAATALLDLGNLAERRTDSEDLARTIGLNVVMGLIIVALKLALPGH